MFFGGRKDLEDPEYKNLINSNNKEGAPMKPSDVRNGDLVSLLLAANPPYLYNMPLVPQTFFFSEMLRSFVQAKTDRQSTKTHHHTRRRKRTWRETSSASPATFPDPDKPLELTTTVKTPEKEIGPPKRVPSCNFTAEKLANSSVVDVAPPPAEEVPPPPPPPMWYHPTLYPNQPIDPLHFFIDLRVSAHIWDRKINEDSKSPPTKCSAFSAPTTSPSTTTTGKSSKPRNQLNVHYIMGNIDRFFTKKKNDDDIRALIGLEIVHDYVKQESDEESS